MKTIHDNAYQVLIKCLRMARLAANVTQADLASELGMGQSYVSKYERGERRLDVVEARAICAVFGVTFSDFICSYEAELAKKDIA